MLSSSTTSILFLSLLQVTSSAPTPDVAAAAAGTQPVLAQSNGFGLSSKIGIVLGSKIPMINQEGWFSLPTVDDIKKKVGVKTVTGPVQVFNIP